MTLTPQAAVDHFAATRGWNTDTLLDLTLDYITNQGSDDAFVDHLQAVADEEDAGAAALDAGYAALAADPEHRAFAHRLRHIPAVNDEESSPGACGLCGGLMSDTGGDGVFFCAADCQEPNDETSPLDPEPRLLPGGSVWPTTTDEREAWSAWAVEVADGDTTLGLADYYARWLAEQN